MADISKTNTDFNSENVNHDDISLPDSDKNNSKDSDFNLEQKDSRLTNPDGAQSPASSTYADCEENDDVTGVETPIEVDAENKDVPNSIRKFIIVENSEEIILPQSNECSVINDKISDCENNACELTEDVSLDKRNNNFDKLEEDYSHPNQEINYMAGDLESYEKCEDKICDSYKIYEDDDFEDYASDSNEKNYDKENGEIYGSDVEAIRLENDDRKNGDGQEINEEVDDAAQKKLDDDEDRRNPQYIPKRGFFYEHDDRTNTSGDETEEKKETDPKEDEIEKGKSKRSIPDGKWQHDLYREDEQEPKSTQELVDVYGYDIRNEEAAPKARRRRKYGRGPNKYTRKWDDEDAYGKPVLSRDNRKIPYKREEYDAQFPVLKSRKSYRRSQETVKQKHFDENNDEIPKSEYETKHEEEFKNSINVTQRPIKSKYQEKPRNFIKRVLSPKEPPATYSSNSEVSNTPEIKQTHKTVINENVRISRGRGIGHGKPERYSSNYDHGSTQLHFTAANRGRARPLHKTNPNHYFNRKTLDSDVKDITEQMSSVDISFRKRIPFVKQYIGESETPKLNEISDNHPPVPNVRSKRYSHQRQRLLPEVNKNISPPPVNIQPVQQQSAVQSVQNIVQNANMCQSNAPSLTTAMPLMTQTQRTPQSISVPLTVSSSIQSSSLNVSGSIIQIPAPPLTASGPALPAPAPPLPIMGFFPHPQGYANPATPAQLYSREQAVIGGPSNQPVQLVAFLPASPMLPNSNHTQSVPPPPPPLPTAPAFPNTVMNYQQTSQTQLNSDSYSIPPVTLAPIPPEVYQSRGGVTYYNTRSQFKPRSPPPPRIKAAIPIVPPPGE